MKGLTGHALMDHTPIISKEQAAADKEWTIQAVKDGRLRATTRREAEEGVAPAAAQRGTTTDSAEVEMMRRQGYPDTQIAEHLGVSTKTLRNRHGKKRSRCDVDARRSLVREARELLEAGATKTAAAEAIGVPRSTMTMWLEAA